MKNPSCYKIITFDQNDDVVDIYSSIHHGLSEYISIIDYHTSDWNMFYNTINQVYHVENKLWDIVSQHDDDKR